MTTIASSKEAMVQARVRMEKAVEDFRKELAAVRTGDFIELDVAKRRIHLDISDAELAERMKSWQRPAPVTSAASSS